MYLTNNKSTGPSKAEAPNSVLLEKSKKNREKPVDAFKNDLSLESLFSKLALVSLSLFVVSFSALDIRSLTLASFVGFIMFAVFFVFLRIRKR